MSKTSGRIGLRLTAGPSASTLVAIGLVLLVGVAGRAGSAGPQEASFSSDPIWSSGHANSTSSLALGDVDRDGDLDLVCGNHGQSNTLYLSDDGVLSAGAAWLSAPESNTRCIALGDIDGDGDLDLVCGNWEQLSALYLNDGDVFQASPISQWDVPNMTGVALGDVDGDGDLDLVCGSDGYPNVLYVNRGGVFSPDPDWSSELTSYTECIALGDIDKDGDLDLICCNFGQNNTLYLNEGGTFSGRPAWSSAPANRTTSMALGDANGDGYLDLVCGNSEMSNVLYLNTGGMLSTDPAWFSGPASATHDVALGDVDADGDLDLFCGNYGGRNALYMNSGTTFSTDPDWLSGPESPTLSVTPGDIDGDGDLDLVCGNSGYPPVSNAMYLNETAGIRTAPAWSSAPRRPTYSIALGDIDGDGDPDLVCGNYGYSNNLYLNDGNTFSISPSWSSGLAYQTLGVTLGDIDGDGDLDLACGNWDGNNTIHLNSGGAFTGNPVWRSDSVYLTTSVVLGDVDGDRDLDLVCGNAGYTGQRNNLYLNDAGVLAGSPAWSSDPANRTLSIALCDVDGDNDPDLVCGNGGSPGQSNTLYLNENGIFSQVPAWSSGPENHTLSIALGDVDGDGDPDLLCGNDGQGNTLYLNQGGALETSPFWSSGPANHTESVAFGDIDGDGDLDIVCGNGPGNNTLYLNEGGTFSVTPAWLSGPANHTGSIALGDLDADGDLDVVCGNYADNKVYKGTKNPVYKGNPEDPTSQLPNNSAYLRSLNIGDRHDNTYEIHFATVDVESDPVWILVDYQFEGAPIWYPADVPGYSGTIGPLGTSPQGEEYRFDWDVARLPFDDRDVILRVRTMSVPMKVGTVRHVSSYNRDLGPVEPRRPQIASSPSLLSFPTLTVGDTAALHVTISNAGNELLTITSIEPPSTEMRCDVALPHNIDPDDGFELAVLLEPMTAIDIFGELIIESNDPISPASSIRVETDVRALEVESRLLAAAPEVPLGEALTVIVTPAPDVHVEGGFLYHRPCGRETFSDSISLGKSADDFIAVMPGEAVTEAGLEYYIKVENSGVFATDPPGAPDDSVFYQPVTSPKAIAVTPHPSSGSDFLEGRDISVFVSLPDGTEFVGGTLYLRMGGGSDYQGLALQSAEPLPTVVIPGSFVTARGLEYWVSVQTLTTSLTYPAGDPDSCPAVIRIAVADLSEEETHPATRYRMVTVPLDFGADFTGTLETLLSDQVAFGPYDPLRWRSYRYLPSLSDYVELSEEYGNEFRPLPGRAFWLISSTSGRISTAPVRGFSTPTDSAFCAILQPGWNQIGDPFVFPVVWDSVRVGMLAMAEAESVIVEPPVRWSVEQVYKHGIEILNPFEGYWVKNLSDRPVVLRIPPREAPVIPPQVRAAGPALAGAAPLEAQSWGIELRTSSAGVVDSDNYAGVRPSAATEWDKHDRSEPPMSPGRAISLYFPHRLWLRRAGNYASDVRGAYEVVDAARFEAVPIDGECWGHVWRFDVAKSFAEQGVADEVVLEFVGLETVPAEAVVYLMDGHIGCAMDLRDGGHYKFYLGTKGIVPEKEARFALLVGSEQFLRRHEDRLPKLPSRTVLHHNYPNPFSVSTIVRYDLVHGGDISLRIYDAGGALVRVLDEGCRMPGSYEVPWVGADDSGRRVAAGIYFCHLRTSTGVHQTRKILLIR